MPCTADWGKGGGGSCSGSKNSSNIGDIIASSFLGKTKTHNFDNVEHVTGFGGPLFNGGKVTGPIGGNFSLTFPQAPNYSSTNHSFGDVKDYLTAEQMKQLGIETHTENRDNNAAVHGRQQNLMSNNNNAGCCATCFIPCTGQKCFMKVTCQQNQCCPPPCDPCCQPPCDPCCPPPCDPCCPPPCDPCCPPPCNPCCPPPCDPCCPPPPRCCQGYVVPYCEPGCCPYPNDCC